MNFLQPQFKIRSVLVLLNISAAFDTVDHHIMLGGMETHEIKGSVLNWFRAYLADRSVCSC